MTKRRKLIKDLNALLENIEYLKAKVFLENDAEAKSLIKKGKVFVKVEGDSSAFFASSRFIGYKKNDLETHKTAKRKGGTETTDRLEKLLGPKITTADDLWSKFEGEFLAFCAENDISPQQNHRSYITFSKSARYTEPTEVAGEVLYEGAKAKIVVNAYERNPKARQACIDSYGYECSVCSINLEERYGSIGKKFIHVHHLVPISEISEKYEVNPIEDLRPVCPNCHAMLHREQPPLTIVKLKELLR